MLSHTQSLTAEEAHLVEVLRDPVLWGESYLKRRDGSQVQFWLHQKEDLRCASPKIVHQDGREAGKTVSLVAGLLHYSFTTNGGSALVATPHQGSLDTIIEEFEFQIDHVPELEASVARTKGGRLKITRKPYFKVEWSNGSINHFRPGGPYGESFRSLHVDRILADEAAWLTESAWKALRQCLLPGGTFRIYSTPNGLRHTTYYRLTQLGEKTEQQQSGSDSSDEAQASGWVLFKWPSWISPLWLESREAELLEFYGGRDSAGWQHEVAGEHGKPTYGAFNQNQLLRALVDLPNYQLLKLYGSEIEHCEDEAAVRTQLDSFINLEYSEGRFWVGVDTGYTSDPSEIVIFEEMADQRMQLVFRIHAKNLPYPALAQLIALIDEYFEPFGIGIDKGGNGLSVIQELTTLDKYRDRHFEKKVRGFDFGGRIVVGVDDKGQPIKRYIKEHMTALINKGFGERRLQLPSSDIDIENQFTSHTYSLSNGRIVYSKGNDHIIDAVRCAVLVRESEALESLNTTELNVSVSIAATDPVFV